MSAKHSTIGRPRKYTDEQVRAVKTWKTATQICKEMGINRRSWDHIRRCNYKKPAP